MSELKSYREAAVVTRRTVRTIKRWRRNGLPMTWAIRDGQRVRVVRDDVLKAWWRERMTNDPVWQNKMKNRAADVALELVRQQRSGVFAQPRERPTHTNNGRSD